MVDGVFVFCVTKGSGGGADTVMKGFWILTPGFSCLGAALSLFPRPRILKTRPLLLHSV